MKTDEHLSDETIKAYRKGTLPAERMQSAGHHLLFCAQCGKLSPPPNKEQILEAILGIKRKPGKNI